MKIPNIIDRPISDKEGNLTSEWKQLLTELITQLQLNVSDEGFIIPRQSSANITSISTSKSVGAIVYDSDTNQFKACVSSGGTGVFKTINLS